MERLLAQDAVQRLMISFNQAEDQLDFKLLQSCFLEGQKFTLDLSEHLPGTSARQLTAEDFWQEVKSSIPGFTATHHQLGPIQFDFRDDKFTKACKIKDLSSWQPNPDVLRFRRAFAQSTIVLQKERRRKSPTEDSKPFKRPKYVRAAWEQIVVEIQHSELAAKERKIEGSMSKLMEDAPSDWREDPQWNHKFEQRAERLAADLEVVQTRRDLFDEMTAVQDMVHQTRFRFSMDDAAPHVFRTTTAFDNAWFAELRALKLHVIAPLSDVGILRKFWRCLSMILKTLPYAIIRPIGALAKMAHQKNDARRSEKNDEKR
ncbi:hypothetical protein PRZ48_013387 [Zasmidium cellare]|uniref:Uncharacterized protein n=1 Tax=Zasmidium cellare TaxID=395010 RepID=A0ABR0E0W7_ZASCE|nr:hypothetical protein PRZ48_013387 [Zasmidium cellare]